MLPLGAESPRSLHIAVLGAGPVGMEAALYGRMLGHQITVYEQGDLSQGVRNWRHVRMFSPWSDNTSPLGLRRMELLGHRLPPPAQAPSGAEFLEQYLLPLARDPLLAGCLRLHSRVVEVGRKGLLKGDLPGQLSRARAPFRLLVEGRTGEHIDEADVVLDSTGTFACPNAIGDGGIPAPGERWLEGRLWRHVPDVLAGDRARFAGRKVLVVGGGASAATAVVGLAQLCREVPTTEVWWTVRKPDAPFAPRADDPLPERARLMAAANQLARTHREGPARSVRYLAATAVVELVAEGHRLRVALRTGRESHMTELFDEVIGLTGYGPDHSLHRELQVYERPLSPPVSAELLVNPEPRFFILGAKSFGRHSGFLLPTGHHQVRAVYALLHEDADLDLYRSSQTSPGVRLAESVRDTAN